VAKFKIKELAQARGLTQETLAIKSGVKMRTVQRLWQNKVHRVELLIMIRIADTLGVDVRDLYADEDESYTTNDIAMPMSAAA
jgi:transcriptional regulator with XRE-family HTH domain